MRLQIDAVSSDWLHVHPGETLKARDVCDDTGCIAVEPVRVRFPHLRFLSILVFPDSKESKEI